MRGLSRIATIYSNIVFESINHHIDELISVMQPKNRKIIVGVKKIQDSVIGYEDDFLEYPIQRIRITLSLSIKDVPKTHPQGFDTTGGMYPFDNKSSKLSYITNEYNVNFSKRILNEISVVGDIKLDLGIMIDENRFNMGEIPKLKLEMMSLIMHELNHGYEFWLRNSNKSNDVRIALSFLDIKKDGFAKKVYNKLNYFLYYIYWALPHEQNAKVHELYTYVLNNTPEELMSLVSFKNIINMTKFNSDVFYNDLVLLIPEKGVERVTKKALKRFIQTYKKQHNELNEYMDENLLGKDNIKDIFKYYEKTINLAGENMKKKVLRLYSIKSELND
jgi:hypothetical protein